MYNMLRVKILYSTVLCDFFLLRKSFSCEGRKLYL